MVLLAVLLAVAYATKSSDQFSRRVVLTWAAVTPALLVLLEILFHEVMHRLVERAVERAQCGLCRMHRSEPGAREGIPEQFRSLHARRGLLR